MRCGMLEIGLKPWKSSKDLGGQSRTRANPTGKCIDLPQAQKLLSSPSWSTSGKRNPRVKWRQAFHILSPSCPPFPKIYKTELRCVELPFERKHWPVHTLIYIYIYFLLDSIEAEVTRFDNQLPDCWSLSPACVWNPFRSQRDRHLH